MVSQSLVVHGEHGDGLTEQVLLEPDALVASYEQVIAFLDGLPEQGAILQEVPSQVVGCLHLVVREEVLSGCGTLWSRSILKSRLRADGPPVAFSRREQGLSLPVRR